MKLGMPLLYEFFSVEENFALADELGLSFVELNLNFSYCRKALENGEIKSLLEKYPSLELTLHFFDEADFGTYPEVVEGYLSLLEKYASLGEGLIKMINIHNVPGPVSTISGVKHFIYEKEYDEYIARLLKSLKKAKDIVESKGISLVIENTDVAPEALFMSQVMIDEHNEGFHFTYDVGHDCLCGYKIRSLIKDYPFEFDELHIHDSDGKRCHLSIGEGTMGEKLEEFKTLGTTNNAFLLLEVKSKDDLIKSIPAFRSL